MTITSLAVKNLGRHGIRTFLAGLGVAVAAGALFSILSFDVGYRKSLLEEVAGTGIHLFVSTEGCPLEAASLVIHGGDIPRFLRMGALREIRSVSGVKEAAGFLIFSLPRPESSRVDLFYGVTDEVLKLKPNWKLRGGWFKDERSIILGADVAKAAGRGVGDPIRVESLGREFEVVGILEKTSGQDDDFHYLPIRAAQRLFGKEGKLTAVGVQLFDPSQMGAVKGRLESLPEVYVVPAEEMSRRILELIGGTKALMYAVLAVALAVSGLGLLNTILMTTFERRKEFGYLRCVGAGKGDLVRLILTETLVLCLAGSLAGIMAGFLLSTAVESWIRGFLPYVPAGRLLRPGAEVASLSVAAVLALGALAGAYPALRASRASPIEALRDE